MKPTVTKRDFLIRLAFPALAWLIYALHFFFDGGFFILLLVLALIVSILESVNHAEVIAHSIGEPFGTLVLAIAVTCIEAALIITLMLAGGPAASTLARDTVFAAVMIILTGMIGMSILVGAIKYKEQYFVLEGANATVICLTAISVLTLILPNYTTSVPGPYYNNQQLVFVAIITLLLYGSLIFVQNFKHRSYFIDKNEEEIIEKHVVSRKSLIFSIALLMVNLTGVVLLAKSLAPMLDETLKKLGAPQALAGVVIAAIILLPEGLSAYKASTKNQLQKSLNLSLGSALASISLTMPVVSFFALLTGTSITLGIDAKSTILFILALLIVDLSLSTGKTTVLQGITLLVVFLVYLFVTIVP